MRSILSVLFTLILPAIATGKPELPPELIGTHDGAMGQIGSATDDGNLAFGEDRISLGGMKFLPSGALSVAFVQKEGEVFERLEFPILTEVVTGATVTWKPLTIEDRTYTAKLSRYGKVFRVLIKLHQNDRLVSGIQWICAEPAFADELYPDIREISKENGWSKELRKKKRDVGQTWTFQDDHKRMYASDQNGDGVIDYLQLLKPIRSHHYSVWIDTDHDGFFDKRLGGKLKGQIKVPEVSGFDDEQ